MRWVLSALFVALALCASGRVSADWIAHDQPTAQQSTTTQAATPPSLWDKLSKGDPLSSSSFSKLIGGKPGHLLTFNGFDIWQNGLNMHSGLQWAARGTDTEGLIVRAIAGAGHETLHTPAAAYKTLNYRFAIMPGYKFKRDKFELQVLAGFDGDVARLKADGRSIDVQSVYGGRLTADLWWEPKPLTMVQASLVVSSIHTAIVTRLAAGWWLADSFWAGPEVMIQSDRYSSQYRIGAHVTALRLFDVEWSLSAGYAADSFQRSGVYARLGMLRRQ